VKPGDLVEYSRDVYGGSLEKRCTTRHLGVVVETDHADLPCGDRLIARVFFANARWVGNNQLLWIECEDLRVFE